MTVVNVETGEIVEVEPDLTATQARELTDRIRQTLTVAHDLIATAYKGRAWVALGYASWDAYCSGEFAEARMVRLDREQRREIVADLRREGMSTPAIGAALGVSDETARRDLMSIPQDVELPPITRSDGASRRRSVSPPVPVPSDSPREKRRLTEPSTSTPKRRPITEVATDATFDLNKVVERLERIVADDRFPQNAEQIARKNRGDLLRAAEALAGVLDRLSRA